MIQCSVVCGMLLVVIAIEHRPGERRNTGTEALPEQSSSSDKPIIVSAVFVLEQ